MCQKSENMLPQEAILRALFEKYESIYVVDQETGAYRCFHESAPFSLLQIGDQGEDFFRDVRENIQRVVFEEDRKYVLKMMAKKAVQDGLKKEKYYSIVYRLMIDGKPLYHISRIVTGDVDGRPHFLVGIRNIDATYRRDRAHAEEIAKFHSKEKSHLAAILASAEAYLEANLSRDLILEISHYPLPAWLQRPGKDLSYSAFKEWHLANLVVKNQEEYARISDRNYLIRCFEKGEKRASASFSMMGENGETKPCKKVFYLYRDEATGDVLAFCVLYDLTEEQRKAKELKELENELQMSRLRNFTSQMQPHFLYNALGSIQEIVLENPAYASELLGDFTVHLRSCIRAMANDAPIPFEQELTNIKAYVNIEKMRFGDKLKVQYDIRTCDFPILPLSVQPLVENAIRHGIYERGDKGGFVLIRTTESPEDICVTVQDNGVGFDVSSFEKEVSEGKRDSTGIRNIMFRLDKVMHASVDLQSRVGEGTTVKITIPKEKKK